ncbi:hypothetical protein Lal_00014508 [Lupinus albus]|nr:hypothetical protein Lal_00014508 [Lupinus albus]
MGLDVIITGLCGRPFPPLGRRSGLPAAAAATADRTSPHGCGPTDGFPRRHRPGLPDLPGSDRTPCPVHRVRPVALRAPAALSAPDPAADDRHRLLLAAGGRADRAVHRHGAGVAELQRLLPLPGGGRHRHRRRAVDHARVGAGAGRPDGRGPHRRRHGGGDRHHAGDRADRRAVHPVDQPLQVSGGAAPDRRSDHGAAAGHRRRHHRRLRRLPGRRLPAGLQRRQLHQPHLGIPPAGRRDLRSGQGGDLRLPDRADGLLPRLPLQGRRPGRRGCDHQRGGVGLDHDPGAERHRSGGGEGRVAGRHRRVGHRQVGDAEKHPRAADAGFRLDPGRWAGDDPAALARAREAAAQVRHAVPGGRPVRQPDGLGECRLRPDPGRPHAARAGQGDRRRQAGRRRPHPRRGGTVAVGAVGRHAEARRPCPRHRRRAGNHLLRRADDRPRPDHGRRHQRADRAVREGSGRHRRHHHPRHGVRPQDRRPHRHDLPGPDHLDRPRPRHRQFGQRLCRPVRPWPGGRADQDADQGAVSGTIGPEQSGVFAARDVPARRHRRGLPPPAGRGRSLPQGGDVRAARPRLCHPLPAAGRQPDFRPHAGRDEPGGRRTAVRHRRHAGRHGRPAGRAAGGAAARRHLSGTQGARHPRAVAPHRRGDGRRGARHAGRADALPRGGAEDRGADAGGRLRHSGAGGRHPCPPHRQPLGLCAGAHAGKDDDGAAGGAAERLLGGDQRAAGALRQMDLHRGAAALLHLPALVDVRAGGRDRLTLTLAG